MNPDPAHAVQVYWNLDNCPVHDDYKKVRDVESCIENSLKLADPRFHITKKVVVGSRYHNKFLRDNVEAFKKAGWSVETTPERELICADPDCDQPHQHVLKTKPPAYQRVQKVADRMLIQCITRNIMAEGEKPKYILLITGDDSDFALTIKFLKESGVTVLLAVGSDAEADFKTKAHHTWLFSEMMSTQAAPPLALPR